MKTIYLHIGTGKTGTSALQAFFVINRNLLGKYSILYPNSGQDTNYSHNLLSMSLRGEDWDQLRILRKALKEEITKSKAENLLISAEDFLNNSPETIKSFLEDIEGNIVLIIYLRRQDVYIQSVLNQWVKGHNLTVNSPAVCEHLCDYYQLITRFRQSFSRRIVVRLYEKQQFYGGNIFSDFLHNVFNMELTDEFVIPDQDINPRLSRSALEFKLMANAVQDKPHQSHCILPVLFDYSVQGDIGTTKAFHDHALFSPQQRLEILKKYAESNAMVAKEFLGRTDGKLFYDPVPDVDDPWVPYEGLQPETTLGMAEYILKYKYPKADEKTIADKLNMILVKGTIEDHLGLTPNVTELQEQLEHREVVINQLKQPQNMKIRAQLAQINKKIAHFNLNLKKIESRIDKHGRKINFLDSLRSWCQKRPQNFAGKMVRRVFLPGKK